MALFDGIVKRTKNINVNIKDARYYHFQISTTQQPIKIFISTPSNLVDFFINAKLINKTEFIYKNKSAYPSFVPI